MGNTDFKQLVFFWIEKYRNLRNAGFNFGSEYVFSVESVDGTLVVDKVKNEKYMPDFFLSETKKRVRNVSAIIGENGSGKSNLLSALRIVLENRSIPYLRDTARYSRKIQCSLFGNIGLASGSVTISAVRTLLTAFSNSADTTLCSLRNTLKGNHLISYSFF